MTTPSEPSGDYGYDLVHEEVRAVRAHDQHIEPARDPRRNVVAGDYSYDQAHGD